jgi:anti-sigma factor RsiW
VICRQLVEFLMDYVEGALPPAERAAFEEHLSKCPDCAAYLATYQVAIRLGRAAFRGGDAVLPPLPEDLVKAIRAARERPES